VSTVERIWNVLGTPVRDQLVGPCLGIVGSPDFLDLDLVCSFVQTLPADTIVVSGGARGVDRVAAVAARARDLRVIEYLADWDRLGRRAGFLRNLEVVRRCDRMAAFWDGASKDISEAIGLARRQGRPLRIFSPRPSVLAARAARAAARRARALAAG